jgi:hypothetical protein
MSEDLDERIIAYLRNEAGATEQECSAMMRIMDEGGVDPRNVEIMLGIARLLAALSAGVKYPTMLLVDVAGIYSETGDDQMLHEVDRLIGAAIRAAQEYQDFLLRPVPKDT